MIQKTKQGGAVEPVSLDEAHIYLRSENSGGIEDELISRLIGTARMLLERALNRSLIASEVQLFCDVDFAGLLPYTPVVGNLTVNGQTVAPSSRYPYVEFEAGTTVSYATEAWLSDDVKDAILETVAFWYERGDYQGAVLPPKVKPFIEMHTLNFFV